MGARAAVAAVAALLLAAPPAVALAATGTERISVSEEGGPTNGVANEPVLSADGRFVAFVSRVSNIIPGDINGQEVFVRDRSRATSQRVAVDAAGNQATRSSADPA